MTWTLGNHLEHLVLTGSGAINGTGNALDNTLVGNAGANVLKGAGGHDTYEGGAGNDTLNDTATSGSDDVYRWGRGEGRTRSPTPAAPTGSTSWKGWRPTRCGCGAAATTWSCR